MGGVSGRTSRPATMRRDLPSGMHRIARELRRALHTGARNHGGESLADALLAAAPFIIPRLCPGPRNPDELAKLRDPAFEYRGHRLEPVGRQLIERISDGIGISELRCWDLLQEVAANAPGATVGQLQSLAFAAYFTERRSLLLLLLDALKYTLCHGEGHAAAVRDAARSFVDSLVSDAAAGASHKTGLLEHLIGMLNELQGRKNIPLATHEFQAPHTDPSKQSGRRGLRESVVSMDGTVDVVAVRHSELRLVSNCVFCCCARRDCPPSVAAISMLMSFLKMAVSGFGPSETNDVLLMSLITMLAPALASCLPETEPPSEVPPAILNEMAHLADAWARSVDQTAGSVSSSVTHSSTCSSTHRLGEAALHILTILNCLQYICLYAHVA